MTAAWRVLAPEPWRERSRNPSLPLAIAAHLAVLAALAIGTLLRVTPVDPHVGLPPVLVRVAPLPPEIPEPLEPEPPGDRGGGGPRVTAVAPRPPEAEPETLPELPAHGPFVPGDESLDALGEGLLPGPEGGEGGPGGVPGGRGTGPGGLGGDPDADGPMTPGNGVTTPVLVRKVLPDYPPLARRAGLEGRVLVEAVIGRDGLVEDAEVVSHTNPIFRDAALGAVRHWRYTPARFGGRPVRVTFRVVVEFRLD